MALKSKAITICYVAWNTSTNAGQTGDAANHTLKLVQDGIEASATNGGTQVDATNAPGVYSLALTTSDMAFNCVVVCGKSSTANVVLIPVVIITERGVLPTVAPNADGGFPILSSSGTTLAYTVSTLTTYTGNTPQTGDSFARIGATGSGLTSLAPSATALSTTQWTNTRAGLLDNLDAAISTRSTYAGGAVASVTAPVTVSLTQTLGVARALDSIADTSLEINDAMHCAIAAAAGKKDASGGTSYIVSTPSTGTVLRTYTLTLISPPATVPDKAV